MFKRGTITEKEKYGWESGSTTSPSSPSRSPSPTKRKPILLSVSVLDEFSITIPFMPPSNYRPNSHLSLSAMVDCWAHLGINPDAHLDVAAAPIFRLFLGVAEDLFQSLTLLESALHLAIYDHWQRVDDLELVI